MRGDPQNSFERLMRAHAISPDEVTFAEPWQARIFAMVLAMAERGYVNWDDFRHRLIDEIAAADRNPGAGASYYESWLSALESLLSANSVATKPEIDSRADSIAANPATPTKASSSGPIRIA